MPPLSRLALAALPLVLAGCQQREREAELPPEVRPTAGAGRAAGPSPAATPPGPDQTGSPDQADTGAGVTPMKDRVAVLGLLNKRNNLTQDLKLKPGESQRIDNVIVKLDACERTAPWEDPPEIGAFVQVFVEERATVRERLAWRKAFSGWLFRNSPSLNVVQHPVYDVWVKDCTMNFPGEDASPADSASAKSAAKPEGRSPRRSPLPPTPRPAPATPKPETPAPTTA